MPSHPRSPRPEGYHEALYQLANTAAESSASPHAASPPTTAPEAALDKKISCMECRVSKVKCSGGDFCSRCRRLGKACYYKSHKRGRKSDSSKIHKLEQTVESLSKALETFAQNSSEQPTRPAAPSTSRSSSWANPPPPPPPLSDTRSPASRPPVANSTKQRSTWYPSPGTHGSAPTPDDPDEPDNLGLPTLSNPLKLLAHASDTARDRDIDSNIDPQFATADSQPSDAQVSLAATEDRSSVRAFSTRFGPARGKAFFSIGLFAPKPDNLPHLDPVRCRILSLFEAESLFSVYMQYINPPLTLLDENLHTFEYVRSTSSFLLCATCWIAAKYRIESSRAAAELEAHIKSVLLPTILLDGYRTAEISQAFIIIAAYHPQCTTLSEDRSWSYVGYAIRIASELDMNSKIASKTIDSAAAEANPERTRRLRNRERTWLNLWLFETSMSQHMGRRPTLAVDPVIMGCAKWHLDRFAVPQDAAMVAVVQLRLIMARNIDLFENYVDVSTSYHHHSETTGQQLELFRKTCASDLDMWLATWVPQPEPIPEPTVNPAPGYSKPPSRLQKAKLYYWYARLILDTIALKCSHLGLEVLRPIYKDAYACAMAYLCLFVATMVPNGLLWGHNSTVVTPAYCAIFALRITGLVSSGGSKATTPTRTGEDGIERGLRIDIDAEYTFGMVEKVIKVFEEAGNVTPHRQGPTPSYAFFLAAVLTKAKRAWRDGHTAVPDPQLADKGRKRPKRSHGDIASSDNSVNAGSHAPAVTTQDETDLQARLADEHFFRQMMQFQAGPSGVQTIPGQTPISDADALGHVETEWDFGMLDGFLGESLFSDMTFIGGTPARI